MQSMMIPLKRIFDDRPYSPLRCIVVMFADSFL